MLLEVCGLQEAHNGLGWATGKHKIFLYLDDGRIAGINPIWVQNTLTLLVHRFERVRMQTNLGKTKVIVCTPGFIWG